MTSQKKIEANRRNAQRSTGPRSLEGKARVALNGVRHGLFCQSAVVPLVDGREGTAAFAALLDRLHRELGPVGVVEESLVGLIGLALWRLRRLFRVERATVLGQIEAMKERDPLSDRLSRQIHTLDQVARLIEHDCALTDGAYALLVEAFGQPRLREIPTEDAVLLVEEKGSATSYFTLGLRAISDQLAEAEPSERLAVLLSLIARERSRLVAAQASLRKEERRQAEIHAGTLGLPKQEAERLSRYEVTLSRELRRNLHELSRLQQERKGATATMPTGQEDEP